MTTASAASLGLDIQLMRRYMRGERQKDLAAELGVSMSRVHQRIERARRLATAGDWGWSRRSTPEDVMWETIAADGIMFSSLYERWLSFDGTFVHTRIVQP